MCSHVPKKTHQQVPLPFTISSLMWCACLPINFALNLDSDKNTRLVNSLSKELEQIDKPLKMGALTPNGAKIG